MSANQRTPGGLSITGRSALPFRALASRLPGLLAVLAVSCGSLEPTSSQRTIGGKQGLSTLNLQRTTATVSLMNSAARSQSAGLVSAEAESFDLVNATAFTFNVVGCASAYLPTGITSSSSTQTITLYKTDLNCNIKLTQFSFGGATYSGSVTGAVGNAASFTNGADPTDIVTVRVAAQLPSPLVDGSNATFIFQQSKKGTSIAASSYTQSETLTVQGVEAPNTQIGGTDLTTINANGSANFDVTFTCGATIVQTAGHWICPSVSNDQERFVDMQARIVTDTFGGAPTYAQVQTAMNAGTGPVSVLDNMKIAGDKFTVPLTGQGPLYTNKSMLIIISYVDPSAPSLGTSYAYYVFTIGSP